MSMGRRKQERQSEFWVLAQSLPRSPGHPFYEQLNQVLNAAGFDGFCEEICRPFYAEKMGRPSIPPGVYFRMLMVGYFEKIDSERGIAWRCSDSLSLRSFLGWARYSQHGHCTSILACGRTFPVRGNTNRSSKSSPRPSPKTRPFLR